MCNNYVYNIIRNFTISTLKSRYLYYIESIVDSEQEYIYIYIVVDSWTVWVTGSIIRKEETRLQFDLSYQSSIIRWEIELKNR